jgi:hypothetical protein
MANNKDFILKNPVEVGGPTNVTLGTVTSNNIDLATGNYFADTPSGASTYTISNAGAVQSFQLEVTGGTAEVAQNFSTTLYTGNSGTQTITNGIDLAGDGGLVIVRGRNVGSNTFVFDTERGASKYIMTASVNAEGTQSAGVNSFNSSGFVTGSYAGTNSTGTNYVSWTFKKEPSFFDVVTYTGTASNKTVSHNLGSIPGMIIVKRTDTAAVWAIYHRGANGGTNPEQYHFHFNTDAQSPISSFWNDTAPTDSVFTVGTDDDTNASGGSYIAYLFAHDNAADGLIQCGSFTTDSVDHATITLGWKPQWLLVKRSDSSSAADWRIIDSVRGVTDAGDAAYLEANTTDVEAQTGDDRYTFTNTGFTQDNFGANRQYIYVAIRAASDLDITWPSSIEWAGSAAPSAPATGETDVYTLSTDDGGTSYVGVKTADNLS